MTDPVRTIIPPCVDDEKRSLTGSVAFFAAVTVLFFNVHTPVHKLIAFYHPFIDWLVSRAIISETMRDYLFSAQQNVFLHTIVPVKEVTSFFALLLVMYPLFRALSQFRSSFHDSLLNKKYFVKALIAFLLLSILVTPDRLGIMGSGYSYLSLSPFGFIDSSNLIYKRLLMPFLANLLQMKGFTLYYIFSMLVGLLFLYLIQVFFSRHGVILSWFGLLSIGTSSFIITQFQSPGYTEPLFYCLFLLLFIVPMKLYGRLSIVVLSILAHEASVFILVPAALLCFSKKEKILTCALITLYFLMWLGSYFFNMSAAFASHDMGGISGMQWVVQHPLREIAGLFMTYKLLWIVFIVVLLRGTTRNPLILAFLASGFIMTLFGVDTTRMMGFSFIALLIALTIVEDEKLVPRRWMNIIWIVNLCIPAVYVGLNAGMQSFSGLYGLLVTGHLWRP
jgi:hypothetical protein